MLTSSIIGPKASLSITLWPVDETSAFCTSSSFAAAAFSVHKTEREKFRGRKTNTHTPTPTHPTETDPHTFEKTFLNRFLSGYKTNTICLFVNTRCHGLSTRTER